MNQLTTATRAVSPPTTGLDELLERRQRALTLIDSALAQLVEAASLVPMNGPITLGMNLGQLS